MSGMTSSRLLQLAKMAYSGTPITSSLIRRMYQVSKATAKRDMRLLEQNLPVQRVHLGNRQVLKLI